MNGFDGRDQAIGGGRTPRDVALDLMRMALALLDREGQGLAAARLQNAIDLVAQGSSPEL